MFSSQTCFLLPELSQIIVFGCVKLFRLHCFLVPPSIAACRLHCSFPLFSERPSINLSIKKSFVIQLSVSFLFFLFIRFSMIVFPNAWEVVGSSGLEPPTSRLSGARSNHLSYEPIKLFGVSRSLSPLVEMMGFEPMTPCLQGRCSPN